ncbi:MAG: oligosaccharide flippase family protein [Oscillospiraceae bacterium]|nr:oligosaccharide flippase family protein [Oscillospiraceae bacterium]
MKRNILKDTLLLTVIQMGLDGLALLLNVFVTRQLGTESVGILTLTASFFRLMCITASGNAFLCVSRFVSEELGKPLRDPERVLLHCISVSMVLSLLVGGAIVLCAPWCSREFLHTPSLAAPIRFMACTLPLLSLTACMRGYYNALGRVGLCAASDVLDFLVHAGLTVLIVLLHGPAGSAALCRMTAVCTVCGSAAALVLLLLCFPKCRAGRTGSVSLSLGRYIALAVPVMAGSALQSALSSINDALVPVTLQQSGDSASAALSEFGIFEAIVIPTLFFPSTVLCSLSSILVTETAREQAAGGSVRITHMAQEAVRKTLLFAVFVTAVLLRFGGTIGVLLGGSDTAGRMIVLLAPVVPFIYLEIVLESLIKGLGAQGFSSVNYLCEYIIRISCVLVLIPVMGFRGVVLSYYASNVCGNVSRLLLILKRTRMRPALPVTVGIPVLAAFLSCEASALLFRVLRTDPATDPVTMGIFTCAACPLYLWICRTLTRRAHGRRAVPENFRGFRLDISSRL